MSRLAKLGLILSGVLTVVVIAGIVANYGYPRLKSLNDRVAVLSDRFEKLSSYVGGEIERRQKRRGSAAFHDPSTPLIGRWELVGGQGINGSWGRDSFEKARALATYDDKIFVGLTANDADGAQVWSYDGAHWSQEGGSGVAGSWTSKPGYRNANSLVAHDGFLLAGIGGTESDAEVWEFDGTQWRRIAGPGQGWKEGQYAIAYSMHVYQGDVYVGLTAKDGNSAAVFRIDGGLVEKVGGGGINGSWNGHHTTIYELWAHDGYLYASIFAGPGDVWRYDGNAWEQAGGSGVNGGWQGTDTLSVAEFCELSRITHRGAPQAALTDRRLCIHLGI